ncbi:MAG: hypothetical protein AAF587_37945 [Bacteroidota bacterium]
MKPKRIAPIATGFLIAILPKCPFCVLAYSSAITMCGSASVIHTPSWLSYISIGLAALTCLFLILNYRGRRTIVALVLVSIGAALISWSELYTGLVYSYYVGATCLLFGVWVNGSFLYVFRKLRLLFSRETLKSSPNSFFQ